MKTVRPLALRRSHRRPSGPLEIQAYLYDLRSKLRLNQATMSIDGHTNISVSNGALITIRSSTRKARFLRLHPPDYFFHVLEEKLKGKR